MPVWVPLGTLAAAFPDISIIAALCSWSCSGFSEIVYVYAEFTGLLGMSCGWAAVLPGLWTALLCCSELGDGWIHSGTCYCILVAAASAGLVLKPCWWSWGISGKLCFKEMMCFLSKVILSCGQVSFKLWGRLWLKGPNGPLKLYANLLRLCWPGFFLFAHPRNVIVASSCLRIKQIGFI